MQRISKFYLQEARYLIGSDEEETELWLDYANNDYKIGKVVNPVLEKLARLVAKELLGRKHSVNFAYKFAKIKEKK